MGLEMTTSIMAEDKVIRAMENQAVGLVVEAGAGDGFSPGEPNSFIVLIQILEKMNFIRFCGHNGGLKTLTVSKPLLWLRRLKCELKMDLCCEI